MIHSKISIVGGANTETIIKIGTPLIPGAKYEGDFSNSVGGGGFNRVSHLFKLDICTGINALLTIGDDVSGLDISKVLGEMGVIGNLNIHNLKTPHSQIIINPTGETTTIQKQLTKEDFHLFQQEVKRKMLEIMQSEMIALTHIQREDSDSSVIGDILKSNISAQTYLNFGATQIKMGYDYWKNLIENKVHFFQLNEREILNFLGVVDIDIALRELTHYKDTTFFITMGEKGTYMVHSGKIIQLDYLEGVNFDIKNTNGAGDAFGSGFIHYFLNNKESLATDEGKIAALKFSTNTALRHCIGTGSGDYTGNFTITTR